MEIRTAASAREGLSLLEAEASRFALIVSDLKMPGMLGSDFLLEVKARYPWIVTVLLTGFSEMQEFMKAVRAGIYSCVLKPWDPDYLKAELEKALEAGRLRAEAEARARTIDEELRWAGEMQRALLKPADIASSRVVFRETYRPVPSLYCGGDYYDFIDMGEERYLVLLGDVAGHGLRASLVTGILKAVIYPEYLRVAGKRDFSPAGFLSWLNERMNFELRRSSGLLITFLAILLDPREGRLRYANAGHCRPYLLSPGAAAHELGLTGPSVGVLGSVAYEEGVEAIGRGDLILAYTDGLTESGPGGAGGGDLALAGLLGALDLGGDLHGQLLEAALRARGGSEFSDDLTILTARLL